MAVFTLIVDENGDVTALERRETPIGDSDVGTLYKVFGIAQNVRIGNPVTILGYPLLLNRGIAGIQNSNALTDEQKAEYLALLATARPTDSFDARFRPTPITRAGDGGDGVGPAKVVIYYVDP